MILRAYKSEDTDTIAGWIRTEDELYKWSADRFNKYPLSGDDMNESYAPPSWKQDGLSPSRLLMIMGS